jgi:hypothetical protein
MAIQVVPYTDDLKERWDTFVLNSNNGTMFHLQKFFDYHPKGRFNWHHLVFLEKKEIIAVLPGAAMGSTFESPIGASYGSVVTNVISFATALELVDAFSEYCRDHSFERALPESHFAEFGICARLSRVFVRQTLHFALDTA